MKFKKINIYIYIHFKMNKTGLIKREIYQICIINDILQNTKRISERLET